MHSHLLHSILLNPVDDTKFWLKMHLFLYVLLLSKISFGSAITCFSNDKGNGTGSTCTGRYCMLMKYSALSNTNEPSPMIVKGCYNWQLNLPEMGCYAGIPDQKMHNTVACFCNSEKCNSDGLLNSTPKQPRQFTCEHSTLKVCTGYACTVTYCILSNETNS